MRTVRSLISCGSNVSPSFPLLQPRHSLRESDLAFGAADHKRLASWIILRKD